MKKGFKDFRDSERRKPWRHTIVTSGCLPCIDIDYELSNNASYEENTGDEDSEAKSYFQFSFVHSKSRFLLDALR